MILDKIVEDKKERLVQHRQKISPADMRKLAEEYEGTRHSLYEALAKPGISIIGECKKGSPSLGHIDSKINILQRIEEYNASVDAISCLTEEDHFFGSVEDLKEIRPRTELPILRKDFMIEEYQFYEAKAIGADAVLLITAILDDVQMRDFYQLAGKLGLDVLVETHDAEEIERALRIHPRIIGVNNRNLKDFSIDLGNTGKLRDMVPLETKFVSESGILTDADIRFLKECRTDGFLIGRALMESAHPMELAQHWKAL
jgi:indole-3-glycerol phosphate synthase